MELENTDLAALVARLETLDPATAATIDRRNKRRVVRAVEICLTTDRRLSEQRTAWQQSHPPVRGVFVVRSREALTERIRRRTASLLGETCLNEVRAAARVPMSNTAAKTIGFTEVAALLAGEISHQQCLERIATATRQYAKRQMTWFRRESFAETISLDAGENLTACAERIAAAIVKGAG